MYTETNYLQNLISNKTRVVVFMTNGFQMRGFITGYDQEAILFFGDGTEKMLYKHAVSTIEPCK